jgi:hypothetical protein
MDPPSSTQSWTLVHSTLYNYCIILGTNKLIGVFCTDFKEGHFNYIDGIDEITDKALPKKGKKRFRGDDKSNQLVDDESNDHNDENNDYFEDELVRYYRKRNPNCEFS